MVEKVIADPELDELKEYVGCLDKPKPFFSHEDLHKIQTETDLSDNKMKFLASVIREEIGPYAVQPGFFEEMKEDSAGDKYMSVEEVIMKVKNPDGNDYLEEKRNLVYCNDIDKVSPSLKVLFKNQFLVVQFY